MTDQQSHDGGESRRRQEDGDSADPLDLRRLDEAYARAEVQDDDFDPVPDGKYQVVVEGAEVIRAKSSGNPMLKWTLKILGPAHRGRLLWRNNVMASEDNLKWLKKDLRICGMELDNLSDIHDRLDELLDLKLEVTKRTRGENDNVYLNGLISAEDDPGDYNDVAERARQPF